jgi:hypothetical protein
MNRVVVTPSTESSALERIRLALTVFVLAWVVPLAIPFAQAQVSVGAVTLNFAPGWNLVGNGSSGTLDVASAFGDSAKVTTAWKWVPSKNTWAFYTPLLPDGGAAQAASKGYDLLGAVNAGEGFWVNAKTAFSTPLPASAPVTSASFRTNLAAGWNLIATGDSQTPIGFSQMLRFTPPATGATPTSATSLWAWDTGTMNWYFYAPGLDAQGGTVLSDYLTSKNYLNFGTKTLDATTGFWANTSNATTTTPPMRALAVEGNWGGNIDGIKNVPDAYIQRLHDDNVNWIRIDLPIFDESISDPTVKITYRPASDTGFARMYSFNDDDLINAVTKFRNQGINVYFSLVLMQSQVNRSSTCNTAQYPVDPHLFGDPALPTAQNSAGFEYQCVNSSLWWWSPSHPSYAANTATFWATYTQVAVKYAKMAQQLGVGMFGLGAESERLFRTRSSTRFPIHFKDELSQMVAAVRAEYTGLVTYDQLSSVYGDHPEWWGFDYAASSFLFQDLGLDVVGLGAYPVFGYTSPVTSVLSVAELEVGWTSIFQKIVVPLQARNPNTPIVFTDTGVSDSVNAPFMLLAQAGAPYVFSDANGNGIDDGMEQQANIYQALFNVNKAFNYLVRGINFFGNIIEANAFVAAANDSTRNSEIRGKPAEQVIRNVYGEWMK